MKPTIDRKFKLNHVVSRLNSMPAVAILGPRQSGKSTIARELAPDHYFDLENPRDLAKLEQPQLTLERLRGKIVIDEVQRKPDLFPLLRYLIDQNLGQKYILLGSASQALLQNSSETLAGRIGFVYLQGFNLAELPAPFEMQNQLWLRGGFPSSFLGDSDSTAFLWRQDYIATFLERDIPQLGINIPAATLRRFWTMLSHYHGQELNYQELAGSFGLSDNTIRRYIEILSGTFMIDLVQPWFANLKKRLVKRPKLYFTDSGLLHSLQQIETHDGLLSHPKLGASWEGFVINQIVAAKNLYPGTYFFFRAHSGSELDFFWQKDGKNFGVEVKYSDAPGLSKSMTSVVSDLNLHQLYVICPKAEDYRLAEKIIVCSLPSFLQNHSMA